MKVVLCVFLTLLALLWFFRKAILPIKHCENFSISQTPFRETAISKEDHNLLYSIMARTDQIFKNEGIEYFMIAGSLLGAERYQGRMPWDDDIDIGMREEFLDRFVNLPFSEYGLAIRKVEFGYKIYDAKNNHKAGSESTFPFIDVFMFREKGKGKGYEYSSDWARKMWPQEYFEDGELYPLSTCIYAGMSIPCPNKSIQFLDRVFPRWDKFAYISGSHTGKTLNRRYSMDINPKTTRQVLAYLRNLALSDSFATANEKLFVFPYVSP